MSFDLVASKNFIFFVAKQDESTANNKSNDALDLGIELSDKGVQYCFNYRRFSFSNDGIYWLSLFAEANSPESTGQVTLTFGNSTITLFTLPQQNYSYHDGLPLQLDENVVINLQQSSTASTRRLYFTGFQLNYVMDATIAFSTQCTASECSTVYYRILTEDERVTYSTSLNTINKWNIEHRALYLQHSGIYHICLTVDGTNGAEMRVNNVTYDFISKSLALNKRSASFLLQLNEADVVTLHFQVNGFSSVLSNFKGFLYRPRGQYCNIAWSIIALFSLQSYVYKPLINTGNVWDNNRKSLVIRATGYYYVHMNVKWANLLETIVGINLIKAKEIGYKSPILYLNLRPTYGQYNQITMQGTSVVKQLELDDMLTIFQLPISSIYISFHGFLLCPT